MEVVGAIALFIIVLSILVLIHECGHFIAARMFGVRVEEFGLGFPPRLWGIKRGETLYSINLFPLGGFVKLKGEQGEDANDPDSFAARKIWQKIIILSAGVTMNFLLAIGIVAANFTIGMPQVIDDISPQFVRENKIQITYIAPESPAKRGGVQLGDTLLSIDGTEFKIVADLQAYIREHEGKKILFRFRRGSENIEKELIPEKLKGMQYPGIGVGLAHVGIVSYPIGQALVMAVPATFAMAGMLLQLLWKSLTSFNFDGFVGPVGIASYTATVSKLGFAYLLNVVAQLSLSLAVLNFLPIPALDGGRVLFALMEKWRGRALRAEIENMIHLAGFLLLLFLLIVVTIKDIRKLFL